MSPFGSICSHAAAMLCGSLMFSSLSHGTSVLTIQLLPSRAGSVTSEPARRRVISFSVRGLTTIVCGLPFDEKSCAHATLAVRQAIATSVDRRVLGMVEVFGSATIARPG